MSIPTFTVAASLPLAVSVLPGMIAVIVMLVMLGGLIWAVIKNEDDRTL